MEALLFIIVGSYLFVFIAVINLLTRTGRLSRELEACQAKLLQLQEDAAGKVSDTETEGAAGKVSDTETEGAAGKVSDTETGGAAEKVSDTTTGGAAGKVSDTTTEGAVGKVSDTTTPSLSSRIAAFVKGGNLWAAGGVILLFIAFGLLVTYMARQGFFTVEMRIATSIAAGIALFILGWKLGVRKAIYGLILQGGGIAVLYLSFFAAAKLTAFPAPVALILISALVPSTIILALAQDAELFALFGLTGGLVAPLLLAGGREHPVILFAYYAVLFLASCIISFFKPWRILMLISASASFTAPLLVIKGYLEPALLFGYYAILDVIAGALTLLRPRRGLVPLAFLFTFGYAIAWGKAGYTPAMFPMAETFMLFSTALFIGLSIHVIRKASRPFAAYEDMLMAIVVPLAVVIVQWELCAHFRHGPAIVALIFSAFYLALTWGLWQTSRRIEGGASLRLLAQGYLGLGTILANVAIPLELSPQITSAVWALEGALIFWLGSRKGSPKIWVAGLLIHGAGAIAFAVAMQDFLSAPNIAALKNPAFTGGLIIFFAALTMAALKSKDDVAKHTDNSLPDHVPDSVPGSSSLMSLNTQTDLNQPTSLNPSANLNPPSMRRFPPRGIRETLAFWALLWWFITWISELTRGIAMSGEAAAVILIFISLSALAFYGVSRRFQLSALLLPVALPPLFAVCYILITLAFRLASVRVLEIFGVNFFQGLFFWVWFLFFGIQTALLFLSRKSLLRHIHPTWLFVLLLLAVVLATSTGRALTQNLRLSQSWISLAGIVPPLVCVTVLTLLSRRIKDGFRIVFAILPAVLSCALALWFIVSLSFEGNPAPLPLYIPLLNPLDLQQAFCIAAIAFGQLFSAKEQSLKMSKPALFAIIDVMLFLWLTAVAARISHYYFGIAFSRLWQASIFQLVILIQWGLYGIAHMLLGNRLADRRVWIAGAALVVAGIVKLLLLDLAGSETIGRIISFFVAGLFLLFIGWAVPLPKIRPQPENESMEAGKAPKEQ